jgi:SAM-dependent methyltransferase
MVGTPRFYLVRHDGDVPSYDDIEEAFQARLDESLDPRGPASLYDLVRSLDLAPGSTVVDLGCGRGKDARALADMGLRVHGVDLEARALADAVAHGGDVTYTRATIERVPLADACADLVWCKEMLMFPDLDVALGEIKRVLRSGAFGLVYQVMIGPRMSDDDALAFASVDVGWGPGHSIRPEGMAAAIARAGLAVRERVDFMGEWGEYAQEQRGEPARRLVHASRLLRDPDRYVAEFGREHYDTMLTDCFWHVERMLGRLTGVAFVIQR